MTTATGIRDTRIFNPEADRRNAAEQRNGRFRVAHGGKAALVRLHGLSRSLSGPTLKLMQAPDTGFREASQADESPAQALVRLLEKHGLEDSLREILGAMETRKKERQKQARLALLEHLLEGQPPITEEELAAVEEEWQR